MTEGELRYPYARVKHIQQFFEVLLDEKDWRPDPLDKKVFETLDLAPSKESVLVGALKFIGIIDLDGSPTKEFDELRSNFKPTLKRLVLASYKNLFSTVPRKLIKQKTLVTFFMQQGFSKDTAEYAGKLFVSLCRDAGIELPNAPEKFARARYSHQKK